MTGRRDEQGEAGHVATDDGEIVRQEHDDDRGAGHDADCDDGRDDGHDD